MLLPQGSVAVAELEYTFTNDTLFKMLFVQHQDLLKRLVSKMLGIRLESIGEFAIANPDMPPDAIGEKFCRLDVNMEEYSALPQTIVISIVAFKLFGCQEFRSEFRALEVERHTLLTDRFCLQYYELPKLPDEVSAEDELKLWLALFKARTDEDLAKIEALEVPVMKQAIGAYRKVTAADDFRQLERLRSRARHNEASALGHARREGEKAERKKWQGVVAEKDTALAEKDALIAELRAKLP